MTYSGINYFDNTNTLDFTHGCKPDISELWWITADNSETKLCSNKENSECK